jgi:transglutaminase-like putative cysteine protease
MDFERFFKFISYFAVFCGYLSLWIAGSFGVIGAGMFLTVMVAAWFLEDTRWQISERVGTALIVLALPVYYFASRYQIIVSGTTGIAIASMLGRLIITLTAIKLLQRKSDRDWIFLYLMAFFEVLLAAGLSISAVYLASFVLYLLVMVCTIIAFEIRKTSRNIVEKTPGLIKRPESSESENALSARRLPGMAVTLIALIVGLGLPLFFFLPRVGSAGFGGRERGVSARTGFSDVVRLGDVGRLQQNDEIVLRARIEGATGEQPDLYWRGIALDTFDGKAWGRSNLGKEVYARGDRDIVPVDLASSTNSIVEQTIYLEPLDTSVLFGLSKIVALRTSLPLVYKDADGGISSSRPAERISYRVYSDRTVPPVDELRSDDHRYPTSAERFLRVPAGLDHRIAELGERITNRESNRYDKAKAVEHYLQTQFGYTLEMKAGGDDPLADFLFNVREGHCEYFATAMAIMLRTQGIATRVVNGFHQGDYNETAGVYVVRQRNAHSWVEVYFPKSDSWIKFDPTPLAGQTAPTPDGISGQIGKYLDALETFWIQYFVAYDNREQRSLVQKVQSGLGQYQQNIKSFYSNAEAAIAEWWLKARGDYGIAASASAIGYAATYLALTVATILAFVWLARRIVKLEVWRRLANWLRGRKQRSMVEFYDRMQRILASKGFVRQPHQTPLEFAYTLGMSEAVGVTEKYNRVRFGDKPLTTAESNEIDNWLAEISTAETPKRKG